MKVGDLILTKYPKSSIFRDEELCVIIKKDENGFFTVLYSNGRVEENGSFKYFDNYYRVIA